MKSFVYIFILLFYMAPVSSRADTLRVAVASNFSLTLKKLIKDFESDTSHKVVLSAASTGKLFAQITHGAPYDIFLSADSKRADLLVKKNLATNSRVYAKGTLVFVAKDKNAESCRSVLNQPLQNRLSIANPKVAPYGNAARQVLMKIGKWNSVQDKLVMAENIVQAYQYVVTGNVDAGFIAGSLAVDSSELNAYCQWQVPASLHQPIKQKMVLLNRSKKNIAAKTFFNYMSSGRAKKIMSENGYVL